MGDSIFDLLRSGGGDSPNMMALRRELEQRRTAWDRTGYTYRGAGDIILQHGVMKAGRELPDQYAHLFGQPNRCFENALAAAEADPSLTYCEGVYSVHTTSVAHAWCLDPSMQVVEVTWPTREEHNAKRGVDHVMHMFVADPTRIAYGGVMFTTAFARWHMENLETCMFDRASHEHDKAVVMPGLDYSQDHDFPVLKVPYWATRDKL